MPALPAPRSHGHGIFSLDSGYLRPDFDAIHLVLEAGRAIIIDTGTSHSVPRVLAALASLGIEPAHVDAVVLTHVHLDHAGGAGALLAVLPQANLLVHPRGARHMIDPQRLWAGTVAVYGEAPARQLYGDLVPAPADRVISLEDGATFALAGRIFETFDAPGHARHHLIIRDTASGHCFTGDTFGISYPALDVDGDPFVFPSSTPVQFDPAALQRSVRRVLACAPEVVYLTHFGPRRPVGVMGGRLLSLIDDFADLAEQSAASAPAEQLAALEAGMATLLMQAALRHGIRLAQADLRALLDVDIRLNAAGLQSWLQTRG